MSLTLTPFQRRTLTTLLDNGPMEPYALYKHMFPTGTFITSKDTGSSKGGPSRTECAVNWHMGKLERLGGWVHRYPMNDRRYGGRWKITEKGREMLYLTDGGESGS